jgi:hypothetical protein
MRVALVERVPKTAPKGVVFCQVQTLSVGRRQKTAAFDTVFQRRSYTPVQDVSHADLNALAGAPGRPSLQAPGFSARITPSLGYK